MAEMQISGGLRLLDPFTILRQVPIAAGMHVGDLGCGGAGHFSLPAGHLVGDSGVVYAVDILKTVLASVENRASLEALTNIRTVWSNLELAEATKIPEGDLDVAMLINILFQTEKKEEVFKETYRLMKKGGKLLIIDWVETASGFGPPAEKRVPKADIEIFARNLNLEKEKDIDTGKYHYAMVYIKK